MGANVTTAGFGALFTSHTTVLASSYGAQNWVIDPVLGNDTNVGDADHPLQTMGEFNNRMFGTSITTNMTLSCVGDVVDAPLQLVGSRILPGAGLTVSGTRTTTHSGTLTAVTGLGPGGTLGPWQVDDTGGIDFTTLAAGTRIAFANGLFAFIRNVVSSTRIVISNPCSTTLVNQTPTVGLAYSTETLSRLLVPQVSAAAILPASSTTVNSILPVIIQHAAFDSGIAWSSGAACPVQIFGCEIRSADSNNQGVFQTASAYQFRGCRFTHASALGGPTFAASSFGIVVLNCVFVAPAQNSGLQIFINAGHVTFWGTCTWGGVFVAQNAGTHMQIANHGINVNNSGNLAGLQILAGAVVDAPSNNAILAGNAGTGFGIDAQSGGYMFLSGLIPQITGAAGATYRVGGTTYADNTALGLGQWAGLLNAIPPTQTNLVNTVSRGPGIAYISQR